MKELTNIMALELTPLSSSWHALVTSSIKSVTEHHIHLHKFRVLGRGSSLHFQLQGAHCIFIYHIWAECWSAGVLNWSFGLCARVVDCVLECWSCRVIDIYLHPVTGFVICKPYLNYKRKMLRKNVNFYS